MFTPTFTLTAEELTTLGRFAAGHISRGQAEDLLAQLGMEKAAAVLDCVDFVGLEVGP